MKGVRQSVSGRLHSIRDDFPVSVFGDVAETTRDGRAVALASQCNDDRRPVFAKLVELNIRGLVPVPADKPFNALERAVPRKRQRNGAARVVGVEEHHCVLVGVADETADDEVAVAVSAPAGGDLLKFLLSGGLV